MLVAGIVIVVASACSGHTATTGAPATSAATIETTVRPRSTTTATAPSVTPAATPEFSFDDSVPPPKLVNTG